VDKQSPFATDSASKKLFISQFGDPDSSVKLKFQTRPPAKEYMPSIKKQSSRNLDRIISNSNTDSKILESKLSTVSFSKTNDAPCLQVKSVTPYKFKVATSIHKKDILQTPSSRNGQSGTHRNGKGQSFQNGGNTRHVSEK
jgi:hypothetical protein